MIDWYFFVDISKIYDVKSLNELDINATNSIKKPSIFVYAQLFAIWGAVCTTLSLSYSDILYYIFDEFFNQSPSNPAHNSAFSSFNSSSSIVSCFTEKPYSSEISSALILSVTTVRIIIVTHRQCLSDFRVYLHLTNTYTTHIQAYHSHTPRCIRRDSTAPPREDMSCRWRPFPSESVFSKSVLSISCHIPSPSW